MLTRHKCKRGQGKLTEQQLPDHEILIRLESVGVFDDPATPVSLTGWNDHPRDP